MLKFPNICLMLCLSSCVVPNGRTDEICKPASDLIFVLDGGRYIDFSKDIITDYSSHRIPEYAVRVGLVLCEELSVHFLPLQSGMTDIADKFKIIKQIYEFKNAKGKSNESLIDHELASLSFLSPTHDSCLVVARSMFMDAERDDVSKMAMFVTNGELWNTTAHVEDVGGLKDDNITVITVAVDVHDIDTLNDLMTIASDDSTCFVVRDSDALSVLAADLSRGTCQPITLHVKYPANWIEKSEPLPAEETVLDTCNRVKTSNTTYEQLLYFPGFGHILEKEVTCPENTFFDQTKCDCVNNVKDG